MKTRNNRHLLILLIFLFLFQPGMGLTQKNSSRDIIMSAMRDEMKRNMDLLLLENMDRPFFIHFTIYDVKSIEINATLGAIVKSDENNHRNHNIRVMVGDYTLNDENFRDYSFRYRSTMIHGSGRLPLEDDYNGIRRALWIVTDNTYKSATELFELKKSALKQQTMIDEIAQLNDYSYAPVVIYEEPPRSFAVNLNRWEKIAEELSGLFRIYPDIYSSHVRIFFYDGDILLANSEGTEVIQPLTLASVHVVAYTQAVDGEPLSNHAMIYGSVPDDLPSLETMKQSVKSMAEELVSLRDAPVFDESYFGPVMFEDQAAAEFFAQRLFSGKNGLLASRRPIVSNPSASGFHSSQDETLDDLINRRILSRDLTVKALPGLKRYQNQNLIGSYEVDAEGVKPLSEIILVENGVLKTMLNNRTPTPKVRVSNAHQRPVIGLGYNASSALGPSVILVSSGNGESESVIKKELLQRASEEGLEYGILIRKLKPILTWSQYNDPMASMNRSYGRRDGKSLTRPILVYRVYVEDGHEELVRSVKLGNVSLSALRHILRATDQKFVYNTLATANWNSGIPSSFIVPKAFLLEEFEVKKEKRDYTPRLPVVTTPLSQK